MESHDDQVVKGGLRLIRSGYVQNIFLELTLEKPQEVIEELISTMLHASYRFYKWGGYLGPNILLEESKGDDLKAIMEHINSANRHFPEMPNYVGLAMNVWWKLE